MPPSSSARLAPLLQDPRLWRATSLGECKLPTLSSGFPLLDAELPGGGWPTHMLSEILLPHLACAEWRLLGPALRPLLQGASARQLLLVNPPHMPHLPGLQAYGITPQQLVWIAPDQPQQILWALEQAIKANSAAAVLAWLPQASANQIRRLQAMSTASQAPVFVFRPRAAYQQSSAAPLRLMLAIGDDWQLRVHLLKRRGPAHTGWLQLPALPPQLAEHLSARQLRSPAMPRHANTPHAPHEMEDLAHEHPALARPAAYGAHA
ncbi:MAG: translesion DNA synthesis-associated protein ImuA [Burkholderiaceae bacterium]|nr:translesion DNA synthesis-associated protein ImuA [Burkholderiaceae bacterium]